MGGDTIFFSGFLIVFTLLIIQFALAISLRRLKDQLEHLVRILNHDARNRQSFRPTFVQQETNLRRFQYRADSELEGIITIDEKGWPVKVLDISQTGALLSFAKEKLDLNTGQTYGLRIEVPTKTGETNTMHLGFRVVRKLETPNAFGGSFVDLDLKNKKLIATYVNENAKKDILGEPEALHNPS